MDNYNYTICMHVCTSVVSRNMRHILSHWETNKSDSYNRQGDRNIYRNINIMDS